MDRMLEPKDEKTRVEKETESLSSWDVLVKVENNPDDHAFTTKFGRVDGHTFESPDVEENVVDSCVCIQSQRRLLDTSHQGRVWLTPQKFSTEACPTQISPDFLKDQKYPIKNEVQVAPISIQNTTGKVKQFIQTQIECENHETLHDCKEILDNIVKIDEFTESMKEAHLVLNEALFYERNFVCNICFAYFPTAKGLEDHKFSIHQSDIIIRTKIKYEHHQTLNNHDCIDIVENIVKNEVCTDFKKQAHLVLNKASFYRRNFVCNICFGYFPTAMVLKDHKLSIHQSLIKSFPCDRCNFKSMTSKNLRIHLRNTHSSDKPFKCSDCEYASKRRGHLIRHMSVHSDEKPFKCDECDYKCKNLGLLTQHIWIHRAELGFRTYKTQKVYVCSECDYESIHFITMRRHKMRHSGEKRFNCNLCDYKCMSSSDLRVHHRIHSGEKSFLCDHCDFKSHSSRSLQNHTMIHSDEKRIKCNICDYRCKSLGELKNHAHSHSAGLPFICDNCDYKCKSSQALKRHQLTHSDEKPLKCNSCDYSTKHLTNLKYHQLKHSSAKRYMCEKCGYQCKRPDTLRMHQMIHSDDKRFKCNVCDYKCKRYRVLKQHKVMHDNEVF